MSLKKFINLKIKYYNNLLNGKNLDYYDKFRYKAIIETLNEISFDIKIEDLNNIITEYKKQQEKYTGQFFSEYHYSLSDRIYIVKSLIDFLNRRVNNENI